MSHGYDCPYCHRDERDLSDFCCAAAEDAYRDEQLRLWAFSEAVMNLMADYSDVIDIETQRIYDDARANQQVRRGWQYWNEIREEFKNRR